MDARLCVNQDLPNLLALEIHQPGIQEGMESGVIFHSLCYPLYHFAVIVSVSLQFF